MRYIFSSNQNPTRTRSNRKLNFLMRFSCNPDIRSRSMIPGTSNPCSDDLLWWNPWTFHHVSTSLHPKTCDDSEILPEFMHHHKHANNVAISWSLIQHTWQQVWINLTGGTVSTLICISTLHCVDHVIVIIEGLRLIYWHGLTKRTSSVKFWFCTFEGKSSRLYVLYIYIPVTP